MEGENVMCETFLERRRKTAPWHSRRRRKDGRAMKKPDWDRQKADLRAARQGFTQAEALASTAENQEKSGGPRAGSGAPTRAAMRAATMGCSACPKGWGNSGRVWVAGGGMLATKHSGQSSV